MYSLHAFGHLVIFSSWWWSYTFYKCLSGYKYNKMCGHRWGFEGSKEIWPFITGRPRRATYWFIMHFLPESLVMILGLIGCPAPLTVLKKPLQWKLVLGKLFCWQTVKTCGGVQFHEKLDFQSQANRTRIKRWGSMKLGHYDMSFIPQLF